MYFRYYQVYINILGKSQMITDRDGSEADRTSGGHYYHRAMNARLFLKAVCISLRKYHMQL